MSDKELPKEWALRWIAGSIVSFLKGRTPLNILLGRIKKSIKHYGVSIDEIFGIIRSIGENPIYISMLNSEDVATKLELLTSSLRRFEGG